MPKVTMIMPVYDAKEFLPLSVHSVLEQTHRNLELILIDDGSPNGCGLLCDGFAAQDARVRVLHQENAGTAAARNAGLALATGDYIGFVDSDDLMEPTMLETLLRALQASGCKVAACQADRMDEAGQRLPQLAVKTNLTGAHVAAELFQEAFATQGFFAFVTWNKLISAELWQGFRFDTSFHFGDDGNIMHLLLEGQQVFCLNETLYHYRFHAKSITASAFTPAKLDDLRLYQLWYRYFEPQPQYRDLAQWNLAAFCERFYLSYVIYREECPKSTVVEQAFIPYRRQLALWMPRVLCCAHLSASKKLRALLFTLYPNGIYQLARIWGQLVSMTI